ncbi:sugar ABC transporter permease [Bacillus sp. FJAT-26390]|uniref:ABC transporter permease n=1 Tax=Bacillus sp. FJAT-26390 TaxID=1743142 RepID=UPI000807E392|nr:ABC transporter permease subunit [Bacillus sp. FJAT-26390]OBZ12836.1 sugar ABC transporter permease [Bacillus sp. FJAT-26390]
MLRKHRVLLLMTVPGILYFLINNYLPMFGVIIAFKDLNYAKGILGSDWVGFKNFEFLFQTDRAYLITRNTVLYNALFIVINVILGVGVAILLNELKKKLMSRFYQSIILLPYLLSAVIVSYLVFSFLSVEYGFVNKLILEPLGLDGITWYSEPKYWPYILTIVNVWKSVGYFSIIYLAAIVGIDAEYYEAATLDGASKWQQVRSITFPLIIPVVMIMTLLQVGKIFNADFGLFYQVPMNSGALMSATDVIDTYVYRALMQMGDVGMASAAGLYQSVLGFLLIFGVNYIVRKINSDHALF